MAAMNSRKNMASDFTACAMANASTGVTFSASHLIVAGIIAMAVMSVFSILGRLQVLAVLLIPAILAILAILLGTIQTKSELNFSPAAN